MMNWWRKSLAAQLLASMLLALFASQAIGLVISWDQYLSTFRTEVRTELSSRAAAVARLVETLPPELQSEMVRVNNTEHSRFWVSDTPAASEDLDGWLADAFARFRVPLNELLASAGQGTPVGSPSTGTLVLADAGGDLFADGARWTAPAGRDAGLPARASYLDYADMDGAGVIVPLSDGRALNVAFYKRIFPSVWATQLPLTLTFTALLVSLVGVLTARRIARPLRQLTRAAETLGRGEAVTPLAECGPDDIRRTAEAFNRMQERLHRFVEDRTRMLAAIGHDLRTPLTTLRLRAELVPDAELQDRMLSSINEMQCMTEAVLSLAKQDTSYEQTRTIDLNALVESICDDLAELGHSVAFAAASRLKYRCRPEGLRRTVRNLVENAVRYAGHADVRLVSTGSSVEIVVEDEGPGIPEDKMEEVFTPFVRLEESRCRETGGAGLGLSIARAVARQHGGDIVLSSRRPGLKAALVLPA